MDFLKIKGAKENNLKNIDIDIPKNKLVVITGLSGSGKSSLAFNTIYAEGHRRYVESLSSYARQFLGQLEKPKVDSIEGLSPTIAIDQKTAGRNPRSTVGTVTEIQDYLRLLYSTVGKPFCPNCEIEIKSQTSDEILNQILKLPDEMKAIILAPIINGKKGEHKQIFKTLIRDGFVRARINGEIVDLEEDYKLEKTKKHTIEVVVDRIKIKQESRSRIAESIELSLKTSNGSVIVSTEEDEYLFSENHSCNKCGFSYEEISPRAFSFNSPWGMCNTCNGLGVTQEPRVENIVNYDKTVKEGCFKNLSSSRYFHKILLRFCEVNNIDVDKKYKDLKDEEKNILLYGSNKEFELEYKNLMGKTNIHKFPYGIEGTVKMMKMKYLEKELESNNINEESGDLEDGLFEFKVCKKCDGARYKKEMLSVKVNDVNIHQIGELSIDKSLDFFKKLKLSEKQEIIIEQVKKEIVSRLTFLNEVGLSYLNLNRGAATLSGGEAQRIRLATQIGSGLTGVIYVLDEPSIGLHQRDNDLLLKSLKRLRDLGNTLIVVEHDEDTMKESDYVIDIGPKAGVHGGEVVAQGKYEEILKQSTLTTDYLSGRKKIERKSKIRIPKDFIEVYGANQNNLKNIDVKVPKNVLCSVTGVSGSGKSTFVNQTLNKILESNINKNKKMPTNFKNVKNIDDIDKIINIDQSPIGRTPRSNPATYIGVFDYIRELYASTNDSKAKGYKVGRFSFNVPSKKGGGRCEACRGDGVSKIEMNFLSDVYVTCDVCGGKRYNSETLEIKYKGKNIHEVLEMNISEAAEFFKNIPKIANKFSTLEEVGLGYIRVGQQATTLSGGEAQRVKLALELSKRSTGKTMYILDEPTTGLHIYDVHKLLLVLDKLVEKGNSVVVIEHNLDVIRFSDYIIDLGPEGGVNGGEIVAIGTPEEVAKSKKSYTGKYLRG